MASDLYTVIATSGRPELLHRTLTSLAECHKASIYRGTIVVENGAKAGAEEVVRSFQCSLDARYVYVSDGNKSSALNSALEIVGDCLIVFTDDDVRIHPGTLCAYVKVAEGVNEGKFYGGPTGVDYECEPPEWLKSYLPPSARGWCLDGAAATVDRSVFLGFNWAAFANDLRTSGGFDPSFGPGAATGSTGQESRMQARLLKRGVQGVYVPEAMVWHYVPEERCSPKWALRRAYRSGIESGMGYIDQVPTIFGFPRWTIRELLSRALQLLVKSANRDSAARFHQSYKFWFFYGYMHGSRIARTTSTYRATDVKP